MNYTYDKKSLIRDGKRWFPIMGEIHYSRVPCKYWADELNKMKAGGVDVVSTYVIWIHHEEIEGEYDWSGERNLKEFLATAKKCGVKVFLRIGPWCHGEVRNGGFPDWLLKKDFEARTNDERYFEVVKKFYSKVYEQACDFLCDENGKDDNTVIGVQIENEYGHCGGLYEKDAGEAHMKRLLLIAREIGFKVPLYTATGWGGAWTGGMIPVMGGYCDAPWDQRITEIEPSGNFTFTHERNDHNIGSDHGFGYGVTFDIKKFPYLTAELGGGLQVTAHRRTIALAKDISAVATVKLGSGVNLLGFYMYHGGTNPEGKLTTLQESTDTGYLNDLPVKSYDFRAPIREFGQVSDTLRELKLLSLFAQDFGEELCTFKAEIPSDNPLDPKNLENLRYSYRCSEDGSKGYLFVNNYVRHQVLKSHENVTFASPDGKVTFPKMNIKNGDFFFFPFNMTFGDGKIRSAEMTPLCALKQENLFVFYINSVSDKEDFIDFEKQPSDSKYLVLSRKDALNVWKVKNHIFVANDSSYVFENENGGITVTDSCSDGKIGFYVYPDLAEIPGGFKKGATKNLNVALKLPKVDFAYYEKSVDAGELNMRVGAQEISDSDSSKKFALNLSEYLLQIGKNDVSDVFVTIDYVGERAKLYEKIGEERKVILDNFWVGEDFPWEIGLKRFADSKINLANLELEILPLKKDAKIYLEKWPEISGDSVCKIKSVFARKEYTVKF